jgi:hypothetical protein
MDADLDNGNVRSWRSGGGPPGQKAIDSSARCRRPTGGSTVVPVTLRPALTRCLRLESRLPAVDFARRYPRPRRARWIIVPAADRWPSAVRFATFPHPGGRLDLRPLRVSDHRRGCGLLPAGQLSFRRLSAAPYRLRRYEANRERSPRLLREDVPETLGVRTYLVKLLLRQSDESVSNLADGWEPALQFSHSARAARLATCRSVRVSA